MGAASGSLTASSLDTWYPTLARPPGTPANWVFGPVWTVLYVTIGLAAWRVWRRPLHRPALRLWGWQLLLNAGWAPAFFGLHSPGLALAVIVLMLGAIALTIGAFRRLDRLAAWLLIPYAIWSIYATYLTLGFWWLNRG